MKIYLTDILACRIISELGTPRQWERFCALRELTIVHPQRPDDARITFSKPLGEYWSIAEGPDDCVKAVLGRFKARLLDERTKEINGSPTGSDVWTVP